MSTQSGGHDGLDIDEKTLDVIIGAYFPRYLGEPDNARSRAQAAYAIASATATALVAAGALGDIESFSWPVQALGLLAVVAWVWTAYRFMQVTREVERRRKEPVEPVKDSSPGQWARDVLTRARDDMREIDRRLGDALLATGVALVLTVATFAAVLLLPAQPRTDATVELTNEGVAAVNEVCDVSVTQLSGELQTDTLDDAYVVLEVPAGICDEDRAVVIRLPPSQVEAVATSQRGPIPAAN